tara:strand:+ start:469 stop:882 length:414 start_codon:yes stop_codon:yes gene_type:complete
MLKHLSQIILFALISTGVQAERLSAAIGCEDPVQSAQFFLLLYKEAESKNAFSKVCRSQIGDTSMEPFLCLTSVRVNATEIGVYSYNYLRWSVNRKTLDVYDNEARKKYKCSKSKDPKSVENYVRNAKQEQLNENQL